MYLSLTAAVCVCSLLSVIKVRFKTSFLCIYKKINHELDTHTHTRIHTHTHGNSKFCFSHSSHTFFPGQSENNCQVQFFFDFPAFPTVENCKHHVIVFFQSYKEKYFNWSRSEVTPWPVEECGSINSSSSQSDVNSNPLILSRWDELLLHLVVL